MPVNFKPQARTATRADLRDRHNTRQVSFQMEQDRRVVVRFDRYGVHIGGIGFLESFHTAARPLADRDDGDQISAKLRYLAAGNPGNQIQPMGADVGDGAELPTEFGVEAPIPISGVKQPVLQEAAMHKPGLADGAFFDEGASFLTKRVVTQVVGNAANFLRLPDQGDEEFGLSRIHGQWLFTEDVFTRAKETTGLIEVEIVWGAEVDDVNVAGSAASSSREA